METFFLQLVRPEHLLFYLFAYGLGSVPTSYLVGRIVSKVNIKERHGHVHAASYLYREISRRAGVLVFILDLLKGVIPCSIAYSLQVPVEIICVLVLLAVIGHCFSVFLSFAGGHGSVTAAGGLLFVYWPAALAIVVTNWLLLQLKYSYSIVSAVSALIGLLIIFLWTPNKVVNLLVLCTTIAIIVRHRKAFFAS